jgi:hypothetical protein
MRLSPTESAGQHRRHWMHDRAFMHGIEFLRVNLEGVDHRRSGDRDAFSAAPHGGLGRAAAGHVQHLGPPRRLRAGDADRERVGDENLRGGAGFVGQLADGHPGQMRDDPVDNGVFHPRDQIAASFARTPASVSPSSAAIASRNSRARTAPTTGVASASNFSARRRP